MPPYNARRAFLFALFFCLLFCCLPLCPAGAESAAPQDAQDELPLTATLAGKFIAVDRGEPGFDSLACYFYSRSVLTVSPYTDYSRSKVVLFSTSFTSPIIARRAYVSYYQELEQVAPYLFEDERGHRIAFEVDENGTPLSMSFDGDMYEPMTTGQTVMVVNLTLLFLHGLCFYAPLSLAFILFWYIRSRRTMWRSFAATRLHTALCAVLLLAALNTFYLLSAVAGGTPPADLQPLLWGNIALMIAMAALPVAMACCWKRSELVRRQKICYALDMAVAVVMLVVMLGWQLYR